MLSRSLISIAVLSTCLMFTTGQQSQSLANWNIIFDPPEVTVEMEKSQQITLQISNGINHDDILSISVLCRDSDTALVDPKMEFDMKTESWKGTFNVTGVFLGRSSIYLNATLRGDPPTFAISDENLNVIVIRENRWIDHAFTGTVIILVTIIYINFGAALQVDVVKKILIRPVGPVIGFVSQFLGMPLISFGIGRLLFPDNHALQLGMFFTGVSPGGGASNIWTAILNGNIDLSITMTTISTFSSFGMMPLWIFTLGKIIFDGANLEVPYGRIATFAISLIIPLAVGLAIQRFLPRLTRILVRILKPLSTILIIFIVVFAIVTNLYIFKLFTWEIIVAGLGLPWLGFILGWGGAKVFRSSNPDALAIAIETGIQNTGIAIYLLRTSLPQPEADITTVVPVAVAIMTPIPLTVLYLTQLITRRYKIYQEKRHGQPLHIAGSAEEGLAVDQEGSTTDKRDNP